MDSFVYQFGGNTFTWQLLSSPPVAPENAFPGVQFILTDVSFQKTAEQAFLAQWTFIPASNDVEGRWISSMQKMSISLMSLGPNFILARRLLPPF